MATNLAIDPDLIDRALAVSGETTKKSRCDLGAQRVHRPQRTGESAGVIGQHGLGRFV